ncbi:MAG: 6-phosphofructokinase, partial [Mariniphaga sp.]
RGGTPSCNDRVMASILGHAAVNALLEGKQGVMVGMIHDKIAYTPLKEAITKHKHIDPDWVELSKIISL